VPRVLHKRKQKAKGMPRRIPASPHHSMGSSSSVPAPPQPLSSDDKVIVCEILRHKSGQIGLTFIVLVSLAQQE